MTLRAFLILLLTATLISAPASAKVHLGEQKFYRDWAVACDNIASCQAVSLTPITSSDVKLSIAISARSTQDSVKISVAGFDTKSDRYRILVDGRFVNSGVIKTDGEALVTISGPDAIKVLRVLAKGRIVRFVDGRRAELGTVSLTGSGQALRYIDTAQNRVGTRSALALAGPKLWRPKSPPKPVIEAKRITPDSVTPDATSLVTLIEGSSCATERIGVTEDVAYSLGQIGGKAHALVMISCGSGAYNVSHAVYVGVEESAGKWAFQPARFDHSDDVRTPDNSLQLLINADWNPATQQLSSYAKGRGIGDCGTNNSYVWDGIMFRLIAAFGMSECRGATDWLPLWQADVKLIN
jgi:Protein of unknown function (DUF1176)